MNDPTEQAKIIEPDFTSSDQCATEEKGSTEQDKIIEPASDQCVTEETGSSEQAKIIEPASDQCATEEKGSSEQAKPIEPASDQCATEEKGSTEECHTDLLLTEQVILPVSEISIKKNNIILQG